jgi:hypothetical protein
MVRGQLGAKVAAPLLRLPTRRDEALQHLLRQQLRRQDHALLLEHVGERRQARRLDPADVGVMSARDREPSTVRETRVTSGRCVPPVYGSLRMATWPHSSPSCLTAATASGIAPRCTGCARLRDHLAALVEERRSSSRGRSLMFAEKEERISDGAHLLRDRPQRAPDHLKLNRCDHVTHGSRPSWDHP